jgi:hypothetical protein
VTDRPVDRAGKENIVGGNQPHTKTPSDGADNTDGGLTGHAEKASMAAERNGIFAHSSRQAPSAAHGDFSIRATEYCAPQEKVIEDFARDVWIALSQSLPDDPDEIEIVQGFREFMDLVIAIEVERANGEEQSDESQGTHR